jgi:hypothetical protein
MLCFVAGEIVMGKHSFPGPHTFNGTAVVKVIENHMGRCFAKASGPGMIQMLPSPGMGLNH